MIRWSPFCSIRVEREWESGAEETPLTPPDPMSRLGHIGPAQIVLHW